MRCGVVLPFGDAAEVADLALLAEASGWDALFVWEPVWGVDAWVSLAAAAMVTERIRLGTMLTPLPRIKPWDLASRVATLDRLSGGRAQLAVGLGAVHEGWRAFEPDLGRRERALLLDEGLAVLDGLMRGQPFTFEGQRYRVTPTDFAVPPPPVQQPRVPVWVVGGHVTHTAGQGAGEPSRSLARAARWDGLLPNVVTAEGVRAPAHPQELAEVVALVRDLRESAGLPWQGFDVVVEGTTPAHGAAGAHALVQPWADAGATWWLETAWGTEQSAAGRHAIQSRIAAGPPVTPSAP